MKRFPVFIASAVLAALGLTAAPTAVAQDGSSGPSLDQLLNLPSESDSGSSDSKQEEAEGSSGKAADGQSEDEKGGDQPGSKSDGSPGTGENMRQGGEPQMEGSKDGDVGENIKVPEEQSSGEFMKAIQDMKLAADRLTARADAGIQTQRVQERALRRLDQIIEQMRNQKPSGGSSQQQSQKQDSGSRQNQSKQKQGQQGQASQSRAAQAAQQAGQRGDVRKGETRDDPLQENLAEWGNLPTRLRDQLLQGSEDRFSPLYRSLTERYYKRLAEESR